jgi:hypothetical protein
MADSVMDHPIMHMRDGSTTAIPVVLTDNYSQMFKELVKMNNVSKVASLMAQIYASWILHNSLWEDAKESYYRDIATGDKYERIEDAPPDARKRLQFFSTRLYSSKRHFLRRLREDLPWFNVETFLARHTVIMLEVHTWAIAHEVEDIPEIVFAGICENVMLYGTSLVREMTFTFFDRDTKPGEFVVKENAPLAALGVSEPIDDPKKLLVAVAKRVSEALEDVHDEIRRTGKVKDTFDKYRRTVMAKGTVEGYYTDTDDSLGIYYTPAEIDGEGNWTLEPAKRYIVKFYLDGDDTAVAIRDLEPEIREYLGKTFRVSITYPTLVQPWEKNKSDSF